MLSDQTEMAGKFTTTFVVLAVATIFASLSPVSCNPAIGKHCVS